MYLFCKVAYLLICNPLEKWTVDASRTLVSSPDPLPTLLEKWREKKNGFSTQFFLRE